MRAEAERLGREWQATFDTTQEAIWILDREESIVRGNRVVERLFGCPGIPAAG